MQNPMPFNARSALAPSGRLYRIYLRGGDLYFIELGGVNAVVEAAVSHFVPIGFAVTELWKRWTERKIVAAIQRMDQQEPEQLLRERKNSFSVYISEIREASIEPPAGFTFYGKQAGCWNFSLIGGKKVRLAFENLDDMKTALSLLKPLLNTTLIINVEWNDAKRRFEKKKKPSLT